MFRTYGNKLSELRLTQAYIKLLGLPRNERSTRSVSLARIGSHEVRMLDLAADVAAESLFWLELYDHEKKSSVDSCNCGEIAQAVTAFDEFVALAKGAGLPCRAP